MADATDTGTATTDAGDTQVTTGAQTTGTPDASGSTTQADTKGQGGEQSQDVEYAFEAPDGVDLDQAQVDAFKALAKKYQLPADGAKAIADIAIQAEVARREAFAKTVEGWGQEVAKDPELGKAENQAAMRKVIDTFGTPELKAMLNSSGLGNHPELARFAYKISKAISEDAVHGKASGEAPKDAAAILYGNSAKA